jgi:hypothetical protein
MANGLVNIIRVHHAPRGPPRLKLIHDSGYNWIQNIGPIKDIYIFCNKGRRSFRDIAALNSHLPILVVPEPCPMIKNGLKPMLKVLIDIPMD